MGDARKQSGGVRPRTEGSLEIDFYYRGVRCRERVKLAPTDKNVKYCERWKARIEDEIAKKEFDYAKHFPESPKVKLFARMPGDKITIETYLTQWLNAEEKNQRGARRATTFALPVARGRCGAAALRGIANGE